MDQRNEGTTGFQFSLKTLPFNFIGRESFIALQSRELGSISVGSETSALGLPFLQHLTRILTNTV